MFDLNKKLIKFGGYDIVLESGLMANQCDSSITITAGNTSIISNIVYSKHHSDNTDFFPLTVNYVEKAYAFGKIPGGFFKREARQSEREILISRLIDRSIRPLFADGFYTDVNVNLLLLSYDKKYDPDILAVLSSSIGVYCAGLPVEELVSSCRIGYINGSFIVNPCVEEMKISELDIVVSSNSKSITMVECQANELPNAIILEAIKIAQEANLQFIKDITSFLDKVKKPKMESLSIRTREKLTKEISSKFAEKFKDCFNFTKKDERVASIKALKLEIAEFLFDLDGKPKFKELVEVNGTKVDYSKSDFEFSFSVCKENAMREKISKESIRIDGRNFDQIREISCMVDVLPKSVHGSALFTRGRTQILAAATIGTSEDQQQSDSLSDFRQRENFILHYNFPAYAAGETGSSKGPGRREIGHGRLAYRSIKPIMPNEKDFPYTVRVVAETMSSDGSTSMGTVCSGIMSLMAAGVPIKEPVAGVAMGLVKFTDKSIVLTDIMEEEDHLGDMDFKVAGTKNGITALQMDIKIKDLDFETMSSAMAEADIARKKILEKMVLAIEKPKDFSESNGPKVFSVKVEQDKIAEIIGKSGANIKSISEKTNSKIDIKQDGTLTILSETLENLEEAKKYIESITNPLQFGEIFKGKIIEIMAFGGVVDIGYNRSGFIHISEIKEERIEDISSVLSEGCEVYVKYIGLDDKKRKKFSMKSVNQDTGENLSSSNESNQQNEQKRHSYREKSRNYDNNKYDRSRKYNKDRKPTEREEVKKEKKKRFIFF